MWFFMVAGWVPSMALTCSWVNSARWRGSRRGLTPDINRWVAFSVLGSGLAAVVFVFLGRRLMMVLMPSLYP